MDVTNNKAIQTFLDHNDIFFEEVIDAIEKSEKERLEDDYFTFNQRQRAFEKMLVQYDVIKTLAKFVKATDDFIGSNISRIAGRTIFDSMFYRNGEKFKVKTQVIDAGGYNIQRYHLRYLSNCNLKETKNTKTDLEILKAKIAKFTKEQKLQFEIETFETRIKNLEIKVEESSKLNDAEIQTLLMNQDGDNFHKRLFESKGTFTERFKDIDLTDHAFQNEEEYELWIDETLKGHIESWKKMNIYFPKTDIKNLTSSLNKLKIKLKKLQTN